MLSLSDPFSFLLIKYLVIAKISHQKEKSRSLHNFTTKVRISVAIALVDAFIVAGIAFFSSLLALGYDELLINVKISFFSCVVMSGLTFFNELKKQVSTARQQTDSK